MGLKWTDEQLTALRKLWAAQTPTPEIAVQLNRTEAGVTDKAHRLKLPPRSNGNWSDEKDDIVRAAFAAGETFQAIAQMVGGGLSRSAVISRAGRLGLTRVKTTSLRAVVSPAVSDLALNVKRSSTVLTFRPRTERADTLSPPLPGSRPRPWTERDTPRGPKLCCWPVDVVGAEIQHSCCMPRELGHKSYCSEHADLALQPHLRKRQKSPDLFEESGAIPLRPNPKPEENQSGGAVLKHQLHPSEIQTMRSENA